MAQVLCLNGPNLDILGRRQPDVYGSTTLAELEERVMQWGSLLGFDVTCGQSNHEGELVEALHSATGDGVIINPGAFTHTSAALHDAVAAVDVPVVEVHLSNVRARDRWRRRSLISPVAAATIQGRGVEGYRAALRHLDHRRRHPVTTQPYGPHPDQVIDLRGESETGVVLVHGGFWADPWGRDTTESWACDLADRGVATANIEYRRLGSGGGSTATTSDAIDALNVAASALGCKRLALVGHSAGAQLAVWMAVEGELPPLGIVSVSGVLDLEQAAALGLGDGMVERFATHPGISPTRLPAPAMPVGLVHGDVDDVVPPDQSRRYASYLAERQAQPDLAVVPEAGHFDVLSADSQAWEAARTMLAGMGVRLG